ncbi:kinase-like protein [Zopfia rhizophila CBS 207.26]|uniref:non-specific serine/threonine protein kinase n=1 Tax=Zopfia rhizophila CBS 207.26 TaxID=1314779 RepID=A0A6A6EH15_9PEZI|nr:kinase-like protein [Zopfia rhizophila CBS 207.26]
MATKRTPSPQRHTQLLEEESFSWYNSGRFYPVHLGEVFESRYQVLGKLGYGSVSTVWLCRDLKEREYVTLKIYISEHRQARNELNVFTHIRAIKTSHPGLKLIRTLRDAFELPGKLGAHQCLTHKPLGLTLSDLRKQCGGKLPGELLKPVINYLLLALDFLHTEARVVHTDIQESNIMMTITDDSILKKFEYEERDEPSTCKVDGDRVIYASRALNIPDEPGYPVLCDFSNAQFGEEYYIGEVMPDLYRAPEIVLGIPWNEKIDIWSIGLMLVWDLFEGKHMFNQRLPNRDLSSAAHLARMITLLGPPPMDLLQRGKVSEDFFDKDGRHVADIVIPATSLESEEENLEGEEKALFLQFLRSMLQWEPRDRKSAKELIEDPWLQIQ